MRQLIRRRSAVESEENLRSRERCCRAKRVRLLSAELDYLRAAAVERTRSIDTKASFVVVAAGVIATATFAGLDDSRTWMWGLAPLVLTVATIVAAAVALWPTKLATPTGREMVTRWVDQTDMSSADLEDHLLEVKTVEVEFRDKKNEQKGAATKLAFSLLILSLVSALVFAAADAAITNGDSEHDKNAPSPTDTPFPTDPHTAETPRR